MSQEEEPIQVTLGGVIDEHGLELTQEDPAPEPEAASEPEPAADVAESMPAAPEATGPLAAAAAAAETTYRVRPGDSWESIAAAHGGLDPDAVYAANADQPRVINAGRHGVPVNGLIVIPSPGVTE